TTGLWSNVYSVCTLLSEPHTCQSNFQITLAQSHMHNHNHTHIQTYTHLQFIQSFNTKCKKSNWISKSPFFPILTGCPSVITHFPTPLYNSVRIISAIPKPTNSTLHYLHESSHTHVYQTSN